MLCVFDVEYNSNLLAVESGTTKKVKGLRLVCNEDFSQAEGRGVEEEEGEGENTLDSSLEEPELVESSPKGVGEVAELQEGTSGFLVFILYVTLHVTYSSCLGDSECVSVLSF